MVENLQFRSYPHILDSARLFKGQTLQLICRKKFYKLNSFSINYCCQEIEWRFPFIGGLYYNTFYGRNLQIFVVFVHGKPFQPSLMFVGEVRSLPQRGSLERCFTRVGSSLTHKRQTRLERFARNKHSSLLQKSVNNSCKMFYSTGPGK